MKLAATIRGLLIEDNPGDARLIREMLRDAHAAVELAHADRNLLGNAQKYGHEQGTISVTVEHGSGEAIARALVELHGGRVWAESTPGAGSTFHVCVPSAEPSVPGRPLQGNTDVAPTLRGNYFLPTRAGRPRNHPAGRGSGDWRPGYSRYVQD